MHKMSYKVVCTGDSVKWFDHYQDSVNYVKKEVTKEVIELYENDEIDKYGVQDILFDLYTYIYHTRGFIHPSLRNEYEIVEYKIKEANNLEFIGQIIDIFEDFLEKRGIHIHNVEQDKDVALIYGEDYFELEDSLKDMLKNWVVIV